MKSDMRQWAADVRIKFALAIVAASTLVAASAMPAPRNPVSGARTVAQSVSIERATTSVAALPMPDLTPAAGSAIPEAPSTGDASTEDDSAPADSAARADAGADDAPQVAASQPTTRAARHAHLSAASLCLTPAANPECAATFNAALGSALAPADVVVTASGSAEIVGPRGAQPLHFQKHAPWVRRLETIGKEGIPFVRIPRGPDREVVVGINRKGILGVSLRERHD